MQFCLFLQFDQEGITPPLEGPEREYLENSLKAVPGVCAALLHEPAVATDPLIFGETQPRLAIQLYFEQLAALETALPLEVLRIPALASARVSQQAMLARHFAVPEPRLYLAGEPRCTYLVAYEGEAEDLNAWLSHYLDRHIPLMSRLPGVREIEVYTRIDWCSPLAIPRATLMQRNKVVFDSPAALDAALASPARREMREDFQSLPPFRGRNTHYPMLTRRIENLPPPARSGGNYGSR